MPHRYQYRVRTASIAKSHSTSSAVQSSVPVFRLTRGRNRRNRTERTFAQLCRRLNRVRQGRRKKLRSVRRNAEHTIPAGRPMSSSRRRFKRQVANSTEAVGALWIQAAIASVHLWRNIARRMGRSTHVPHSRLTDAALWTFLRIRRRFHRGKESRCGTARGFDRGSRTDADSSRIESLKQACANVVSQANIWMSGAGTQSSIDFGMPDPAKCSGAASCSSTQYFDGSACVSNTQTNTTSGSCSSELIGLLGSECHSMGSGWFNGEMTKYVTSYNSQTVRSCTTEPVSGCSGGDYAQPQSCPSGQYWSGSSCVTSTTQQPPTPCGSGQYWNGSSCVTSTTGDGTYGSECRSQSTQSACSTVSGCYWYTGYSGSYCDSAGSTVLSGTSCPSGQYWNGSSCVATTPYDTTYSTASAQQGCATAGGTWDSAANYCRMPTQTTTCASGQYWNGSSCVTTTSGDTSTSGTYVPPPTDSGTYTPPPTDSGTYTPPPTSTESAPISYIFCPEGHDWNGAYCTLSPRSPFERYTANAWSAFRSVFGF